MVKRFVVFHLRCVIFWVTEEFPTAARPVSSKFLMSYQTVQPPAGGKVTIENGTIHCPDNPVIPFIRGDGTGSDIWAASERVFNAAVERAYRGRRRISWFEVFAGETAKQKFDTWLPDDTVQAFRRSKSFWSESKVH